MIKRLFLMLLLSTLIIGCGFKLRGNLNLSDTPSFVSVIYEDYIEEDHRDIVRLLKRQLESGGSTIIDYDEIQGNDIQNNSDLKFIEIISAVYEKAVRTKNAQGLATSYDLVYEIEYDVFDNHREILPSITTLLQRRNLEYAAGKELETEKEETFLKKEMERDLVFQIIRGLQSN